MQVRAWTVLLFSSAFFLTACSSVSPARQVDWRHGAHRAWVVAAYDGAAPGQVLPECLKPISSQQFAEMHWVKVKYWHVRQMFYEIAELPAGAHAQPGDEVEFWPADCATGQFSHVSKILSQDVQQ